jgi:hypothetical protein
MKSLYRDIYGTYMFVADVNGTFLLGIEIFKIEQISESGLGATISFFV